MSTIDGTSEPQERESSSNSPWKPTKNPNCDWAWYEEVIKYDPSLEEILELRDGFQTYHKGFKYGVTINENGSIAIFLTRNSSVSGKGKYDDKKQSNRINDFGRRNGLGTNHAQVDHLPHRKKVNLKMIKYEEFKPEEEWEIDDTSICMWREERYVVLVQWKSDTSI
jgi:hypothetical protein